MIQPHAGISVISPLFNWSKQLSDSRRGTEISTGGVSENLKLFFFNTTLVEVFPLCLKAFLN